MPAIDNYFNSPPSTTHSLGKYKKKDVLTGEGAFDEVP